MSQQMQKYIYKYQDPKPIIDTLEILKLLKLFSHISNISTLQLSFLNWHNYNKIISNFFTLNLFFKHNLLFIQKFLTKKLKKRKWKYKKRRINKIRFLRKLRKSLIHKKFSQRSVNLFKLKINHYYIKKLTKKYTPLINKIPLTQRVLNNSYLEFFYKFKKDKTYLRQHLKQFINIKYFEPEYENFTIYLRNYHQKPFWKLRLSRIIHWNFFFKKKTLRTQRYKSFLKIFIKRYEKYSNLYIYLLNLFILPQVSWTRTQGLVTFFKKLLTVKLNTFIFLIPTGFFKLLNWRKLKKKSFRLKKKIGKWSYLNFKKFQYPWLQKKKNFPKVIKHLKPNSKTFKKLVHYDPGSGSVMFLQSFEKLPLSFSEMFKANYLTKLHGYRYTV